MPEEYKSLSDAAHKNVALIVAIVAVVAITVATMAFGDFDNDRLIKIGGAACGTIAALTVFRLFIGD